MVGSFHNSGSNKPMPVTELMPFNECRFDACMAYLAAKHGGKLDQYDMVKLHVLMDVFHTLEHGKPIIGGEIEAWQHGPVVKRAYNRVAYWWKKYDETGEQPPMLRVCEQDGKVRRFEPAVEIDDEEFSPSELEAMERAWHMLNAMEWDHFHDPDNFIGRAWLNAKKEKRSLDWNEIIDAYDESNGGDHSDIKALIRF